MGVILAWVLVRYEFSGKRIMNGIIELPFALPTAVAGIALTHLTTTNGLVGAFFYNKFGIEIAYTKLGITVALIFIGFRLWCGRYSRCLRRSISSMRRRHTCSEPIRDRPCSG